MPLPNVKAVLVNARANARALALIKDIETQYLQEVRDSVIYALDHSLTLSEWEPSFDAITTRFGYGTGPANYTEMVFRTVGQSAYNGGKASEMFGPEGQARAAYWQFSAVMDDRTTDECAALDGQIFAKTDADAMDFIPPLDYNCRSTLIELDDTDVEGETISAANTLGIDVAFDNELLMV